MTPRRWMLLVGALAAGLVGAGIWLALSALTVVSELTAARDDLLGTQTGISEREVDAVTASVESAAVHAGAAVGQTSLPIWGVAAAIPMLGDTPEAIRAITSSLDEALAAIAPAVDDVVALDPSALVADDGTVDAAAISAALPGLSGAEAGIVAAQAILADAPAASEGDFVLDQVERARVQLDDELATLAATFGAVVHFGEIGLPLLGADGPKRYFVGILNPNEARGVGGFLGTWAIVRADAGKLTVEAIGSNDDLPSFVTLPVDLGSDFQARYGDAAGAVGNMNISPHFPDAAQLWLAAWEEKTGEALDGALAADVVALGELVEAGGGVVLDPDGNRLSGTELAEYAVSGIYERYPSASDSGARNGSQELIARVAADVAFAGAARNPEAVAQALAEAISQRRVLAWVTDEDLQSRIIATTLGGSLAAPDGSNVAFVALNSSVSKLDTYLTREARYDVGRCPDPSGGARSEFSVILTNDIPEGATLPEYVVAQAEVGPEGPINSTLAQVHLPNGSQIIDVTLDGEPAAFTPFPEQGRPSLVVSIELPPRAPRTLTVVFQEPVVGDEAAVTEQPLFLAQATEIAPRGC